MPKLPLAATAVASILVTLATGSVAQTLSPNLPLAIICLTRRPRRGGSAISTQSRRMVLRPTSREDFGLR